MHLKLTVVLLASLFVMRAAAIKCNKCHLKEWEVVPDVLRELHEGSELCKVSVSRVQEF